MLTFYISMLETEEQQDKFSYIYQNYVGFMYHVAKEVVKEHYLAEVNSTPFVRQYDILFNKWGVLLCQKEYQTNDIRRNSREWL